MHFYLSPDYYLNLNFPTNVSTYITVLTLHSDGYLVFDTFFMHHMSNQSITDAMKSWLIR